jgi:hypothetical protein
MNAVMVRIFGFAGTEVLEGGCVCVVVSCGAGCLGVVDCCPAIVLAVKKYAAQNRTKIAAQTAM